MKRFIVKIDQATIGRFDTAIEAYEFAKRISENYVATITVTDNFWGLTWIVGMESSWF